MKTRAKYSYTDVCLEPFGTRLVVEALPAEHTTKAGLFIPENSREYQGSDGIVAEIGPDVTTVEPGDKIFYKKFAGVTVPSWYGIDDDKREFHFLDEEDILGAVTEMDWHLNDNRV